MNKLIILFCSFLCLFAMQFGLCSAVKKFDSHEGLLKHRNFDFDELVEVDNEEFRIESDSTYETQEKIPNASVKLCKTRQIVCQRPLEYSLFHRPLFKRKLTVTQKAVFNIAEKGNRGKVGDETFAHCSKVPTTFGWGVIGGSVALIGGVVALLYNYNWFGSRK